MLLSLKAISLDSYLYSMFKTSDGLLLSMKDYLYLSKSPVIFYIHQYMYDADFCKLF